MGTVKPQPKEKLRRHWVAWALVVVGAFERLVGLGGASTSFLPAGTSLVGWRP